MNKGIEKAKQEGGKCLRCGDDEFRIDGYCSIYCRDMHDVEQERDAALNSLKTISAGGEFIGVRARDIANEVLKNQVK